MQRRLENPTQSICSACGYPNTPGEQFCQNCGVQLAPVASIPPPPPQPIAADQPARPEVAPLPASVGKLLVVASQVEIPLPVGKAEILVGRSDPVRDIYPDVDLALYGGEQAGVSRLHLRMVYRPEGVQIEDLNSTNFTYLNGQRLQPGQWYPLQPGDILRLGRLTLEFRRS